MIKPHQLMIVSMLMMTYVITSSPSQYVEFHSNHEQPNIGYAFRYFIDEPSDDGVSLDHWESKRALDGVVTGGYGVRDANGVVRTVYYRVEGDKGFEAVIKTVLPGGLFYLQQQFHGDDNHLRLKQPTSPIQHVKPI